MKDKTVGGQFRLIGLKTLAFMCVLIICFFAFSESQEDSEADQYNEMIHNLQLNDKNVWSDGYYIIVKE